MCSVELRTIFLSCADNLESSFFQRCLCFFQSLYRYKCLSPSAFVVRTGTGMDMSLRCVFAVVCYFNINSSILSFFNYFFLQSWHCFSCGLSSLLYNGRITYIKNIDTLLFGIITSTSFRFPNATHTASVHLSRYTPVHCNSKPIYLLFPILLY